MICEGDKALMDSSPEMQTENGETTEISVPHSISLAVEPFIIENNKVGRKRGAN